MRKAFIRSILLCCISAATIGESNAQLGQPKEYVEPPGWGIGMTGGLSDLWGDVGTKSVIDHYANDKYWNKPCFMGGMFARYSAHPAFAIRLGISYGTLYASDTWNETLAKSASSTSSDAYQRYIRNQTVRTNIWEGSVLFEISPRRFNYNSNGAKKRWQPYLLVGVAGFHFNPQAQYKDGNGNNRGYVNLYDLNVEGNGLPSSIYPGAPKKYSLWSFGVPLGIGMKWDIGRRLALGVEYVYRITFTDYLDNVSGKYVDPAVFSKEANPALAEAMADKSYLIDPSIKHTPGELRGNPNNNDAYSTFGLTLIFKIPSKKTPWWY